MKTRKGFTLFELCVAIFIIAIVCMIAFTAIGFASANKDTINLTKTCTYNISHYGKIVGKTKMPCMGPVIEKDGRTVYILEQ